MNRRFARRIRPTVRGEFPDKVATVPDPELEQYLVRTINRAQSYGLETDNDLTTFIRLTLTVSTEFDLRGIFHSILTDKTIPNHEKIEALFERTNDEDWEEAVRPGLYAGRAFA
ncbi:MAG TPA: hypothetical protein VE262_00735 [Blastocatellia bacterium]|nr:hypothetical protein [Blastocatellia bacterium]